ncbi:hypothetical protein GCM10022224_030980 [Nonomuraea antimicrobica]|uniref:Secreted protein n=1 Tax=Nonomuraea antimicrobica TaxID=561173 RepID=A0ABP7BLT6_9ACTN
MKKLTVAIASALVMATTSTPALAAPLQAGRCDGKPMRVGDVGRRIDLFSNPDISSKVIGWIPGGTIVYEKAPQCQLEGGGYPPMCGRSGWGSLWETVQWATPAQNYGYLPYSCVRPA